MILNYFEHFESYFRWDYYCNENKINSYLQLLYVPILYVNACVHIRVAAGGVGGLISLFHVVHVVVQGTAQWRGS